MLIENPEKFAVPELFPYEILSVLYHVHPVAKQVFDEDINVIRWQIYYVYVALAEELGGIWLTFDTKAHKKIVSENLSLNLFETGIV